MRVDFTFEKRVGEMSLELHGSVESESKAVSIAASDDFLGLCVNEGMLPEVQQEGSGQLYVTVVGGAGGTGVYGPFSEDEARRATSKVYWGDFVTEIEAVPLREMNWRMPD